MWVPYMKGYTLSLIDNPKCKERFRIRSSFVYLVLVSNVHESHLRK